MSLYIAPNAIVTGAVMGKRVFQTKSFARWSRKVLPESTLFRAALEIEAGIYEADLGKGLCKKRVALPGKGKSGSARTLVAFRYRSAIVFLAGRQKSESSSDFSDQEVEAAKILSAALAVAPDSLLEKMRIDGTLVEIFDEQK
jgi:hypothetical protein